MKTKIVYSVVSSKDDVYALQAWVSILSLRHYNPDSHICILCDDASETYLKSLPVSKLADEMITVDFSSEITSRERSRRIKTGIRKLISGDFLYIDTDTVITGSLEEIDNVQESICAVKDSHCGNTGNPYFTMNQKNATSLGYSLDNETDFFNGGVIYAKDDKIAASFYEKWNKFYDDGTKKGIFIDQTSFAKANISLGHTMKELPGEWNCQLKHGTRFLRNAKIVHYLWTAKRAPNPFILGREEIWNEIRETKRIPQAVIDLFDNPNKGIQELTYLASSEEALFLNSRIYKVAYKFRQNAPVYDKLLQMCTRALDLIFKITHKKID